MPRLEEWLRRFTAILTRRRVERELEEELRFHQEMKEQALEDEGVAPEVARVRARRAIGGGTLRWRERVREVWVAPTLDATAQDVRLAIRMLRRQPGFALTAIGTIALGVGLNTAIFSMVYGVLLKPLRYGDPARLVMALHGDTNAPAGRQIGGTWRQAEYHALVDGTRTLDGLAAFTGLNRQLTGRGEPEQLWGLEASANFLHVIGVAPTLGRGFVPGAGAAEANARSILISDGLWRRAFGADPGVIGQTIVLDGEPRTIVGVLPPGFAFRMPISIPYGVDLLAANEWRDPHQNNYFLFLVGRLKQDATIAQAEADLTAIHQGYAQHLPDPPRGGTSGWFARVVDLRTYMVGSPAQRLLLILAGAVLLVLLIVAVNIANLQLARWSSRRLELSLRIALGAGGRRLIVQLLTESLVLAVAGGALGVTIAFVALPLLLASLPPGQIPRLDEIHVNIPVLTLSLLLALGTGLFFGLLPAIRQTTLARADDLRSGSGGSSGAAGRTTTSGRQTERLRSVLVTGQIALTLVLLISAGLLMRSFVRLLGVPAGFDRDNVLTLTVVLPDRLFPTTAQVSTFTSAVLDRLTQMPNGIATSASSVSMVPLGVFSLRGTFEVEGQETERFLVSKPKIGPNYFKTIGIPLLSGRDFQSSDVAGAPNVAIISEAVARRFWPDSNALGKHVRLDGTAWSTIVGIVGDIHQNHLQDPPQPAIYVPYSQESQRVMLQFLTFVVRTSTPQPASEFMRQAIREVAPDLPVAGVKTMETLVSEVVAEPRTRAMLLGGFALCALLIATLGLYGVMTYAVTQRRREIGIRMAVGAAWTDVVWLVLQRALVIVATGAIIGIAASFAMTQMLASFLFEITPSDPLAIAGVTLLLVTVAITAAWLPARRAAQTDPVEALRVE